MTGFVRIGDKVINVDHIAYVHIEPNNEGARVYLGAHFFPGCLAPIALCASELKVLLAHLGSESLLSYESQWSDSATELLLQDLQSLVLQLSATETSGNSNSRIVRFPQLRRPDRLGRATNGE